MTTAMDSTELLATCGMSLESQAPWLRCLRTAWGPKGTELENLIETESFMPIVDIPVSIRVAVDLEIAHGVISRSLTLLARISIATAVLAHNINNIREEIFALKGPEVIVWGSLGLPSHAPSS